MYDLFYIQLCKTAFKKLGDEALVEELVQDVFLNIWLKRMMLDDNGSLLSYLHATLRNKALHEIRARMIKTKHHLNLQQLEKPFEPNQEDEYVARETELKINAVIQNLPTQCQEAFKLSRQEQLSYKQIAERMEISVNTVEKHIGKALKLLREEFKDYDMSIVLLIGLLELYHLPL